MLGSKNAKCWRSIHGVNHAHAVDTCGRACFCTWTGCPDCFLCPHDEHHSYHPFEVSQQSLPSDGDSSLPDCQEEHAHRKEVNRLVRFPAIRGGTKMFRRVVI